MNTSDYTDAQLVALSREGRSDAFAAIVRRYQSLVCSVAYNDCGSLSGSEEIGHDTFVAAWTQLTSLNEPDKLRSWLCGIARNLSRAKRRRDDRHAVGSADEADPLASVAGDAEAPDRAAITAEEESILWRSLERIPALYREPLILFYREGHSTAAVATLLGESEETVRQRLSRGRKRLQEEVAAFVEGALTRSAPAPAFTSAVMGALPPLATLAKPALAVGAGVAKLSGAAIGSAFAMGALGSLAGYKMGLLSCDTPAQRAQIRRLNLRILASVVGFLAAIFALNLAANKHWVSSAAFAVGMPSLILGFFADVTLVARRSAAAIKALIREPKGETVPRRAAYCSRWSWGGIPLLHIDTQADKPVRGWIAVSNGWAYGRLVAIGGGAVAPIAIGGLPMGVIAFGGIPVGLVSIGGAAIGLAAIGGVAIGFGALGSCAIGAWATGDFALGVQAATGEFAGAGQYAIGHPALAAHANDAAAHAFMAAHRFFAAGPWLMQHYFLVPVLAVAPILLWAAIVFGAHRARQGC